MSGRHNSFCSAGGWPCPIGCETWPLCPAEGFPNLRPSLCPERCPVHGADSGTPPAKEGT